MQAILKGNKVLLEFAIGKVDEDIMSFLSAVEIAKKSKAKAEDILKLSGKIKSKWWKENKQRFINENSNR
jgi:predicted HTH domain antitoxin